MDRKFLEVSQISDRTKMFEEQEVKVKTNEGVTLINLFHVAKCCGLTKRKKGIDYVRWTDRGIAEKLQIISSTSVEPKVKEEITYILNEIENTDDRNSIYISSWLSKRLAIECHSEKANRFKNWLVTLDEARENGNFVQAQIGEEVIQNMDLMVQNMQIMSKAMTGIQQYVQDSIHIKDRQIDDMAELVGLRSKNVSRLTGKLKEALFIKYKESINASDIRYLKAKDMVFKEFKVYKWEDIPVNKYNAVEAFILEVITD